MCVCVFDDAVWVSSEKSSKKSDFPRVAQLLQTHNNTSLCDWGCGDVSAAQPSWLVDVFVCSSSFIILWKKYNMYHINKFYNEILQNSHISLKAYLEILDMFFFSIITYIFVMNVMVSDAAWEGVSRRMAIGQQIYVTIIEHVLGS